ncbi:ribose-phosphate diphosphokinase [Candidatus Poribacteria bacterium]
MPDRLRVFSGNSNPDLAQEIADRLYLPLGEVTINRFSNDNIKVKINESVRGKDVFVVHTSCPPVNDNIMEMLIMLHALKSASAGRITAVIPYFPYVRSDKKDEPRISITAKLMAELLATAGADRVLTMDLHADQIQGFFDMPADQLLALPILCKYFEQKQMENVVVVAGDVGRAKLNRKYAERLDAPLAILDKRREDDDEKAEVVSVIGDVDGKNAVMFDDEILTGGSLIELVRALKEKGANQIYAGITHGILAGPAVQRIEESLVEELVVTNTVPVPSEKTKGKIKVLSVAELFSEAIKRIHHSESVSSLFIKQK